jgi:GT2 family glycosyltransferase
MRPTPTLSSSCVSDVFAVIVTYGERGCETKAFTSLAACAQADAVTLLVYDNSPTPLPPIRPFPGRMHYVSNPQNGGLVAAYNHALECATQCGATWLLLLDQDTSVPRSYLTMFGRHRGSMTTDVVAAAPHVYAGKTPASPKAMVYGRPRLDVPALSRGIPSRTIVAINSGLFVKVDFLRSIGGFPSRYWLDAVDFWFSAMVSLEGKQFYLLPSVLHHELSVRSLTSIRLERWKSITESDATFAIEMLPRRTRAIAGMEGLLYAAYVFTIGRPDLARLRIASAMRVLASLRDPRPRPLTASNKDEADE